ncbi:MAG: LCP family protein [Actinomycetota bacterium]
MRNLFRKTGSSLAARGYDGVFRSVRTRPRLRRRWRWIALGVAVLLLATGGYGLWKYRDTMTKIHGRGPGILPRPAEQTAFNALLVGSDSRAGLTEEEQHDLGAADTGEDDERADTLILAHVDPASEDITMVQFPRDLYVPMPGGGRGKINSALEMGNRHLIETVEGVTGLTIHRYAQVNIAGFRAVVDAIGGVDVCIPEPIPFDPQTGIEVAPDEVGMVHFDGEGALRFVRSRKVFEGGDFDRIVNQQKFLAAAIDKVTSSSTLFRPDRLNRLADVAARNLALDKGTSIPDLRDLLGKMRSFDPEHYEAYTVPNLGASEIELPSGDPLSIVRPDRSAMTLLFEALAANQSPARFDGVPDLAPSTIAVGVYNGTSEEGVAAEAAERLQRATGPDPALDDDGVEVVDVGNATSFDFEESVIRFRAEARPKAELIAAVLPTARFEEGKTPRGVDVAIIVGSERLAIKRLVQLRPLDIPAPRDVPAACRP